MAPLRTSNKRLSNNNTKWLSAEAVKAKRLRRRLEKRWITSGHSDDRTAYRQACRRANKLINDLRRSYHSEMIDGCTDSKKHGRPSRKSSTNPSATLKNQMRIIKSGVNPLLIISAVRLYVYDKGSPPGSSHLPIITFLILPMLALYLVN